MNVIGQLGTDLLSVLVLAIPAWLTHRLLRRRPTPLQAVSETLLLALTVVPIPVFTLCLLTHSYIDFAWMSLGGATLSLAAGAALYRREGKQLWTALHALSPATPGTRGALAAGAAVFCLFLVNYDGEHFQYACINGVVMQAITPEAAPAYDPRQAEGPEDQSRGESDFQDFGDVQTRDAGAPMALIGAHGTGQRLGTTAVIAPMVALFELFGFRLTYAALLALCTLFGVRLLLHLTARPRIAVAGALLAVCNPYVAKIVILDENVMAFAFITASLALLLEARDTEDSGDLRATLPLWLLAGLAFGAGLGIRHVELPFAAAAALLIGWRPRALGLFGAAALVFVLPCALHHQVTYGSVFAHEHFNDEVISTTTHAFLGMQFEYGGLLNWPFNSTLIRTPYNPYPTALYYPLNLLAHLGSALCAVAIIGVVVMLRSRRRLALALAVWVAPLYGLLSLLENWMDPNKMGILITLFPAVLVALGLGLDWIVGWRRAGVAAVVAVALSGMALGAGQLRIPDDARFYAKYGKVRAERSEYYDFERGLVSSGSPLPSLYFLEQYSLFRPGARLRSLGRDWIDRRFRRPAAPVGPAPGSAVSLSLDLTRPLVGNESAVTAGEEGFTVDATGTTPIRIAGLSSWERSPAEILVARSGSLRVDVYVRFGKTDFVDIVTDRHFTLEPRERPDLRSVTAAGEPRLALRVRSGDRVRILESVCMEEVLVYAIEVDATTEGVRSYPARRLFHN